MKFQKKKKREQLKYTQIHATVCFVHLQCTILIDFFCVYSRLFAFIRVFFFI